MKEINIENENKTIIKSKNKTIKSQTILEKNKAKEKWIFRDDLRWVSDTYTKESKDKKMLEYDGWFRNSKFMYLLRLFQHFYLF